MAQYLGLMGASAGQWNQYASILVSFFIDLEEDEPNNIIWTKNNKDGSFFVNLGYDMATKDEHEGEHIWWWMKIWKIPVPVKTILTLWLALNNKLLTWENLTREDSKGRELVCCVKMQLRQLRIYFVIILI